MTEHSRGLRRAKSRVVLSSVLASGVVLIGATQPWASLTVEPEPGVVESFPVAGQVLVPVLVGLGLAGLALAAALTIVGRVTRLVLGAILVVLAGTVAWTTISAVRDPLAGAAAAISERTGIAGRESVARILADVALSPWPWIVLIAGVVMTAAGIVTLATGSRWPRSTRKYDTAPAADAPAASSDESAAPVDAIDGWDELSRGHDPTR